MGGKGRGRALGGRKWQWWSFVFGGMRKSRKEGRGNHFILHLKEEVETEASVAVQS